MRARGRDRGEALPCSTVRRGSLKLAGYLATAWLALGGAVRAQPWFPVDGQRRMGEHPLHIRLQVPEQALPFLRVESLQESAALLGQTLEVTTEPVIPGCAQGVLGVRLVLQSQVCPEPDGGLRTANSNEDGSFWVCLGAIEQVWERTGWRFADLTREQALANKFTFAVKHEIFVHQIGLAIPSRGAIFRIDDYEARGFLDSGAPEDTFYDRPRLLRANHPYILWRRQQLTGP